MMRGDVADSINAVDAAVTEAYGLGSGWGRLRLAALETVIEHLGRLDAVIRVPVIDGEFVDASKLYEALGLPTPGGVRGSADAPTDLTALRQDYDAERARVDKLLEALIGLVKDADLG